MYLSLTGSKRLVVEGLCVKSRKDCCGLFEDGDIDRDFCALNSPGPLSGPFA